MTTSASTVLITGGAGFIGSALIRHVIRNSKARVINLDKLTYAATPEALEGCAESARYRFIQGDIADRALLGEIFWNHKPSGVIHLAAESHVDRSIDHPSTFVETNVVGTSVLLDAAWAYYTALEGKRKDAFRLHHVSTDEVFGSLSKDDPAFTERTPYDPRSPYSASKAGSDHLVRAWGHTYGLPTVITNCSNNYGPWQFPEKLIPVMILSALDGKPLPVYGKGENVRDWLFVEDHAEALWQVFFSGQTGKTYNIGGKAEMRNIDVVHAICAALDDLCPRGDGKSYADQISFVDDRPGHDQRYAMDISKIEKELGWRPAVGFEEGLKKTISWYLEHEAWWRAIQDRIYDGRRLGLK